ncbi:MAG: DUF6328 family protein [Candidatus Manganitrophus sp.]|nr:DUF6328 family protein [Candidatus Manganitrophus sp.]
MFLPAGATFSEAREGGLGAIRAKRRPTRQANTSKREDRSLLMEMRVALPGAQALLGFQFAIFLSEQLDRLPSPLKYLHLVSLCFISITTILLMTPAAYHRIVEEGRTRRVSTGFPAGFSWSL